MAERRTSLNATVTVVVLLIAAVKTYLVIWHFMEVRHAPRWLKAVTGSWALALFSLFWGSTSRRNGGTPRWPRLMFAERPLDEAPSNPVPIDVFERARFIGHS